MRCSPFHTVQASGWEKILNFDDLRRCVLQAAGSLVDKAKLETVPRPVLRSLPILDLWGHLCAALLSSRTFVRETLNNFSACSCHIVVLYSTSFCSFPHPARASEGRNFGLRPSELWESGFLPFPPWVPFLPRSFVIGCLCVFFSLSHLMPALSEASFLFTPPELGRPTNSYAQNASFHGYSPSHSCRCISCGVMNNVTTRLRCVMTFTMYLTMLCCLLWYIMNSIAPA